MKQENKSPAESSSQPLIVRAILNQQIERPPVWLMRQAGRYLSEYRELKEKHSFLGMCNSSELALEVSLQPIRILGVDAAILFSDILLPAGALGIEVDFKPGPVVKNPIRSAADINSLQLKPFEKLLSAPLETLGLLRREMRSGSGKSDLGRGVIGFAGAPYTMACYLIDQGLYKGFLGTQVFAKRNPAAFGRLLELLTELVGDYLVAQYEAGADLVQLFDTWGGNLGKEDFCRYSLPSMQAIFAKLKQAGCPTIAYVNGGGHLIEPLLDCGSNGVSVDWRTPLSALKDLAQSTKRELPVVQGNFDPTDLFLDPAAVHARTRAMIASWASRRGYIVNLGHGVLVETPRASVIEFVRAAQEGWSNHG